MVKESPSHTASPVRPVFIVRVDGSVMVRVWVTNVDEQLPLSP